MPSVLNKLHKKQPKAPRRLVAWLLVFVCAWMGTGGVLHHSELGGSVPAGTQSSPSLHRDVAPPAADACAACEWTQGLAAKTSAVRRLPLPLFLLHPYVHTFSPPLAASLLRRQSSRAPPASA